MTGPAASPPEGSRPGAPGSAWGIARRPYADLSGAGAERIGGHWTSPGRPAVYLAQDAALPVVELLALLDLRPGLIPEDYVTMHLDLTRLPARRAGRWLEEGPREALSVAEARRFGDQWLEQARSVLLRVPSIIVPTSFNLILNPRHPDAAELPEPSLQPFDFESRLSEAGE